ncbi:thyrotropin receptor-like [Lytechinus variegatus]|uniref:thyrotropin receptor-like n=1 Tax=Lytechinus variegatus TaxID=7654 RepID=UPI001BB28297|nr:thyrotropin receptor-like [Lytechinus variegatus]
MAQSRDQESTSRRCCCDSWDVVFTRKGFSFYQTLSSCSRDRDCELKRKRHRIISFRMVMTVMMSEGYIDDTDIEVIRKTDFLNLPMLKLISIKNSDKLEVIEEGAFTKSQLILIELDNLPLKMPLPNIIGELPHLTQLQITRCNLNAVPNMTSLTIDESQVLLKVDLSWNNLRILEPGAFKGLRIHKLNLERNNIATVPDYAFRGSTIENLSLAYNPISTLAENAFAEFDGPENLSLEKTDIDYLPTTGLKYLIELNIEGTDRLSVFPPIFRFERIRVAKLTYFSHCCAFNYQTKENYGFVNKQSVTAKIRTTSCPSTTMPTITSRGIDVIGFGDGAFVLSGTDTTIQRGADIDDYGQSLFGQYQGAGMQKESLPNSAFDPRELNGSIIEESIPVQKPPPIEDGSSWTPNGINPNITHDVNGSKCDGDLVTTDYSDVMCTPQPNAFHPCSDVMGYVFLRVMVWFVSGTALVGNFIVLVVLASQRHKMTVPKFLMCNLSLADLCMGLYLLMVASVDIHTRGAYFNYSFQWQYGAGCSVAGFISMFSSELSVFSLTVITIERWYTIIYAIDLNKRIRLRLAARIMIVGWVFSILVAVLPLFNVGNYGITSMCLPFYIENRKDTVTISYVIVILFVNTIAFAVICACYIKMYLTVRNPHTVMQRKDSKVAKRMAVLVFTDFACWAPMALFGLSGALGHHLLSTNQSKIFIVLFYPINSCANPFLYAIFTKAFRRDLYLLLAKHGMCEKQAMKYHPTATSGQRSVSQINSTAHDNKVKQYHRDSSGSVLTGITSYSQSSVGYEKDFASNSNGSPQHPVKPNSNSIPMVPFRDERSKDGDNQRHQRNDIQPNSHPSTASDKHQSFVDRVNITLEVSIEGLETVPEEVDQNDNYDGQYEPTVSFYKREGESYKEKHFLLPQVVQSYHSDDEDVHSAETGERNRNNCGLTLTPHQDYNHSVDNDDTFRKNSRADSGIQSNNTTPTDKEGTQKQLDVHLLPCSTDHETVL